MTFRLRQVRQIDALRDWLEMTVWEARQAACLLAGVLPAENDFSPATMADKVGFGAWLPGREPWEHAREIWASLVEADICRIETILKETGPRNDPSPRGYLALGAKLGFSPPWLKAAKLNEACLSLLPDEFLVVPSPEKPLQIANRKKARERWDTDDKRVLLRGAGRAEFDRLRAQEFDGYTRKDGSVVIIRVARAVLEAVKVAEPDPEFHPSPRTAERNVKEWLEFDCSDNASALSDSAGAQVAK